MTKIFSIYDTKAEAYMQPFFATTLGLGIRMFTTAVNEEDHAFNKNAEDYTLFELGSFDEQNGAIIGLDTPKSHCNALTIRAQMENTRG